MPTPLITPGLPGFDNTVPLDIDQGPPAPLNLDPFGPNPWAGGGQSPMNTPSTGTVRNLGATPTVWGTVLLLAILLL
jgi:hypothetical protein